MNDRGDVVDRRNLGKGRRFGDSAPGTRRLRGLAEVGLMVVALAAPAQGQFYLPGQGGAGAAANIEGFTVVGKGSATARPDRLEIDLTVAAASELTADAIVKYRDAKKRIEGAFADLKLEDVSIEERGLTVNRKSAMQNPYGGWNNQQTRAKTEVELSRRLVVRCTGLRELDEEAVLQLSARLLDVAQDAGGQVGGGSTGMEYNPYYGYVPSGQTLVRFVVDDFREQKEEAFERAVADARAKAQRLAKLGGVRLGPVIGMREVAVAGDDGGAGAAADPYMPRRFAGQGGDDEGSAERLVSTKFEDVPVRVVLMVQFGIGGAADGAGGSE